MEEKDRIGEVEEEKKVEEFFRLIRRFQEARNRRREELNHEVEQKQSNKKKKKSRISEEEESSNWIPCFEWKDFTEEIEFRRPPTVFPAPCNYRDSNNQANNDTTQPQDALDLKLTL